MLCGAAANAACLNYTRFRPGSLRSRGSEAEVNSGSRKSEVRTRRRWREEEEAHHVVILSWRPTKMSGFKRFFFPPPEWCCCCFLLLLETPVWSPHCTKVSLPLFMLPDFSMSWNAMFLVLLTLYSVITFYNKFFTEGLRLCRHSGSLSSVVWFFPPKNNADILKVEQKSSFVTSIIKNFTRYCEYCLHVVW